MTFVHMENSGSDIKSSQQTHTADTHDNFLANPHGGVAAIHSACQVAIVVLVFHELCVEQIHDRRPDIESPCLKFHLDMLELDRQNQRSSVFSHHQIYW